MLSGIAESITKWCLYLAVLLLPIFVVPVAWISIPQGKVVLIAALVLAALVAWLVSRIAAGALAVPKSALLSSAMLLPLAYAASALVNGAAWSSFVSGSAIEDTVVIVSIWYVLLALIAAVFSGAPNSTLALIRAFYVGSLALVLFQIGRLFFPAFFSLGGYLSGDSSNILGSWHDLGILCALLVFLSLALWRTPMITEAIWKAIVALVGIGSFFLLIVINAADIWFALAILCLLFALVRVVQDVREGERLGESFMRGALVLIILAVISGAFAWWGSSLYPRLPQKLQVVQLEVRPSWEGTYSIASQTLRGGKAVLFGSGPNSFTRAWGLFKPVAVNQTDFWNVDFNAGVGLLPTALVSTGALGLAAWVAVLLALLWSFLRFTLQSAQEGIRGLIAAALGGALFLAAFHIMYVPGISLSILFFILIGVLIALEKTVYHDSYLVVPMRSSGASGVSGIVASVLVFGIFALAPITALRASASDILVQHASVAFGKSGNIENATKDIQRSLRLFPQNDLAHRAAVEVGLVQLSKLISENSQDDAARQMLQGELENTIQHGLSAVSIDSADYQNWLELAVLYQNLAGAGVAGAYENAKNAYEKTIAENPTNPLPHVRLAQLLIAQNDADGALKELNTALTLKPNLAAALYLRSQLMAADKRLAQAIDDAANAATLAAQDPVGWYNLGTILYSAGSYDLSTQALERAVSIQNNYANAIFVLGLSYDNLGRHEDALRAMQAVQQLNPSDATVGQVIANIQSGKPALTAPSQ